MAYETFLKKCLSTIEICTTKKASGDTRNSKQFKLPWFTDELKRAISLKNKLYKFHQVANTLKSLEDYKTHRNKLTRLLKNARAQYIAQKFSIYQSNSRKTWQLINQYVGEKKSSPTFIEKIQNAEGVLSYEDGDIASNLNSFFANVGPQLASNIPITYEHSPSDYLQGQFPSSLFLHPTDSTEIKNIFNSCKKNSGT